MARTTDGLIILGPGEGDTFASMDVAAAGASPAEIATLRRHHGISAGTRR